VLIRITPRLGCSTAVYDGELLSEERDGVQHHLRYSPVHSLYACAPTATVLPSTTDRGIVAEFIQFKLDVNDPLNRFSTTQTSPPEYILQRVHTDHRRLLRYVWHHRRRGRSMSQCGIFIATLLAQNVTVTWIPERTLKTSPPSTHECEITEVESDMKW
jgi:hypothetical protein